MSTSGERIAFMICRTAVALGLIGLAAYCVAEGIHFFALPRADAEQISVDVLGLHLGAAGIGAVVFGAGIAIAFFAARTAPRRHETKQHDSHGGGPGMPPGSSRGSFGHKAPVLEDVVLEFKKPPF